MKNAGELQKSLLEANEASVRCEEIYLTPGVRARSRGGVSALCATRASGDQPAQVPGRKLLPEGLDIGIAKCCIQHRPVSHTETAERWRSDRGIVKLRQEDAKAVVGEIRTIEGVLKKMGENAVKQTQDGGSLRSALCIPKSLRCMG